MRMVKYFFRSVGLLLIVGLLWGKSTSVMAASPVTSWTDSLRVSIVDSTVVSTMGNDYLQFTIVLERLNKDWNTPVQPDTVLGNSDLYFYANFAAFDGDPVFTYVHDSLSTGVSGGPGRGNPDAILQANVAIWAERLHIALTRQDPGQGNSLIGVSVNANAKYKLKLTLGKVDTLCTVRWKLRNPKAVNLGIVWDEGEKGSTGLQTFGGNPIIETLTGDVKKLPSDLLDVDCMENKYWACEGGPISIGLHAESTGRDGLVFEWYDSIPGADRSYPVLRTSATQDQTTSGGKRYTYDYSFSRAGDTLYIEKVPSSVDSIYLYCLVRDTSLSSKPEAWCSTQLIVRDSIKGFVSPLSDVYTLNTIDTVTKCAGEETVAVRFNFFGITDNELFDLDSIYMVYWVDPGDGGPLSADTVSIDKNLVEVAGSFINGMPVYYWQAEVKGKGLVYINKIWTPWCDNATVAGEYDTLFIKEDNQQMLPRVTVAAGESVQIDSVGSAIFDRTNPSRWPTGFQSLRELAASISKYPGNKLPFTYTAKDTTGLDTVLYKMSGDQCAYMREVEVQTLKYLTVKVYLWGAWDIASNAMVPFMGREVDLNRYTNMMNVSRAYYKSPDSTCLIPTNRLRQLLRDREANGDVKFVDWIRIDLVKADPNVNPTKPFIITHKIDSVSGFLRTDGIVCDTAGKPYLSFKNLPESDYYVLVRHRNHLGIISNQKITLHNTVPNTSTTVMVDFTSTIAPIAGQVNIAYYRPTNVNNFFMFPGNTDGNDRITTPDRISIFKNQYSIMDYYLWDIDFNQRSSMVDVNFWDGIFGGLVRDPVEAFR